MKKNTEQLLFWLNPELDEKVRVFMIDEKFTEVQQVILLKSCYKGHPLKRNMDGIVSFLKEMSGKAVIIANNHDAEIIMSDEKDEALFLLKYS